MDIVHKPSLSFKAQSITDYSTEFTDIYLGERYDGDRWRVSWDETIFNHVVKYEGRLLIMKAVNATRAADFDMMATPNVGEVN